MILIAFNQNVEEKNRSHPQDEEIVHFYSKLHASSTFIFLSFSSHILFLLANVAILLICDYIYLVVVEANVYLRSYCLFGFFDYILFSKFFY